LGSGLAAFWLISLLLSTPEMREDKIAKHANLIAFLGALIFLSHPIQTESVTYIFQRATCLAGFFYILSLCLYLKSRLLQEQGEVLHEAKGKRLAILYTFSFASALLAMFTKENTLTLPAMILLCEFFFFKKRRYRYTIPFLILIPIIPILLILTKSVISKSIEGVLAPSTYNELYYFLTQFRVIITYIRLCFIPVNQNLNYDYPLIKMPLDLSALASILALVIILIAALKLFKRHRLISFSIFWFFITILPESSLVHVKGDCIYEHWLYLPLAGYSLFLVSAAYYFFGRNSIKLMVSALIAIVACYSVLTYARNLIWKDELTLWNDVIRKSPQRARPYDSRGLAYFKKGNLDQAISDYNKSITIYSKSITVYSNFITVNRELAGVCNNRGLAYFKKGNLDQAISDYNKAIEIDPELAFAYYNRGNAYVKKGNLDQAISDYNKAITIDPEYADAYSNRGNAYLNKGNLDQAISDYNKAITIDPEYADAYYNRGNVYLNKDNLDQAISDYNKAIEINPELADVYYNRGNAYLNKDNPDQAISDYNKAITIDPEFALAYNNRGVAYFYKKDYDKSWKDVHKAKVLGYKVDSEFIAELKKASGREK